MKFTKLSLAALAAMAFAGSAFAVENVKVDGQIKLWYQTTDSSASSTDGFGQKDGATGDLFAKVNVSGDLTKNAGFGFGMYALTTAGLENNLVSDVASGGAGTAATNGTATNPYWLGEAFFTYKAGNTILKMGRQALDTPLAFTETWNAAPNTYEAAVVLNNDLPSTTLVGAFVSRGNSTADILATSGAKTVQADGTFSTIGTVAGSATPRGAYAVGAVTTLIPMVTAQAWYYSVNDAATAYWLQADAKLPMGLGLGAQYANLKAAGTVGRAIAAYDDTTDAYAVQATVAVADINLAASYSAVSKGTLAAANVGTGFKKTKLYTASILADGTVAAMPDVTAWKVSANTKLAGLDLAASYGKYAVGLNTGGYMPTPAVANLPTRANKYDPSELDVSVGGKLGDVNVTAYYISETEFNAAKADKQAIRIVAAINF